MNEVELLSGSKHVCGCAL